MKRTRRKPDAAPLALPHERDEHTDPPAAARKVIKQAARDLRAGLVDTDNYTRTTAIAAIAPAPKRRARRRGS